VSSSLHSLKVAHMLVVLLLELLNTLFCHLMLLLQLSLQIRH